MAKARPLTGLDAQAPVEDDARLIVKERLEDMYRWERFVDKPYNIRELHDLRIAAKRLRYSFEIFEEVLPDACQGFVAELTRLQDEIGALHDCDVMIAMLRLCLASQDSEAISQKGQSKQSSAEKPLVPADLSAHMLKIAPDVEQRYGLELFMQQEERLREKLYVAFRQHWYQLKARDFRGEILGVLDA